MPRLRIAIDLTALMPQRSGVDVYLRELVFHLGEVDSGNEYHVFANLPDRRLFEDRVPGNFHVHGACPRPRPARLAFQQALLPAACAALRVDVLHSPSFLMPLVRGRQAHVLSVHDMTFFSMPHLHNRLRRSLPFRRAVMTSIRRANLINVPSAATRDALIEWVRDVEPDRVRVTPYGVGSRFHPASPRETERERRRLGLPKEFLLHLGTLEPRKNLLLLVESFRRMVARGETGAHLVLAGRLGWGCGPLLEALQLPELRGLVHRLGFVSDQDLPWLLRAARLLVYPSLCEGFGFPPLEAMACGTPVVAARNSALEENLRGAVELVPSHDCAVLGDAVKRLLDDEGLRRARREEGLERASRFRWDALARNVLGCYEEAASGFARGSSPPRG